jgi:hypothetical protein
MARSRVAATAVLLLALCMGAQARQLLQDGEWGRGGGIPVVMDFSRRHQQANGAAPPRAAVDAASGRCISQLLLCLWHVLGAGGGRVVMRVASFMSPAHCRTLLCGPAGHPPARARCSIKLPVGQEWQPLQGWRPSARLQLCRCDGAQQRARHHAPPLRLDTVLQSTHSLRTHV